MIKQNITPIIRPQRSSKAETILNDCDFDNVFETIYSAIISNIQKSFGKGSELVIDQYGFDQLDHRKKRFD